MSISNTPYGRPVLPWGMMAMIIFSANALEIDAESAVFNHCVLLPTTDCLGTSNCIWMLQWWLLTVYFYVYLYRKSICCSVRIARGSIVNIKLTNLRIKNHFMFNSCSIKHYNWFKNKIQWYSLIKILDLTGPWNRRCSGNEEHISEHYVHDISHLCKI